MSIQGSGPARPKPHAAEAVETWGVPRGWRVARDVHPELADQLPGPPFHDFRKKMVPVLAAGPLDGGPGVAVQLDFAMQIPDGASYSGDRVRTRYKTVFEQRQVLLVELPAPVPELVLTFKRRQLPNLFQVLNRNGGAPKFQGRSTQFDVPDLDAVYHRSGSSPDYVRSVLTPQRVQWLHGGGRGPAWSGVELTQTCLRLSGRNLAVWSSCAFHDPRVLDALHAVAGEVRSWIPPQAFQDPAAAQAEHRNVPLADVRVP